MARRVVVTGLGLVTPLGVGVPGAWKSLLAGSIGTSSLANKPNFAHLPSTVACTVPCGKEPGQFDSEMFFKSDWRSMSRGIAYSLLAAEEALTDANWKPESNSDCEMTGVAVGMAMPDLDDIHDTGKLLDQNQYRKISPYFVPRILNNMAAGQISIRYGFQGPNHAVATACTTGAHAIGDALTFIQEGHADVMVCGAGDACVTPIAIAGFCRLRALSTSFNDNPKQASRPFDKRRDGFVMGEGAGILVLEELTHAKKRNARIYAEILGYGLSADAHGLTAPDESGRGAYLCMQRCMQRSKLSLDNVGYINTHGTSTPVGDGIECKAIHNLFGEKSPPISSTKGATGHLLGAAGAVEAIFTTLAVEQGKIPGTANLDSTDISLPLRILSEPSTDWALLNGRRIALTNSFGFGGTNATISIASFV